MLEGDVKFRSNIRWDIRKRWPGNLVKMLGLRSGCHYHYLKAKYLPWVDTWLIKDPIGCFSAEYIHREFDAQVVVILRHPAAFVSSMKRVGWTFDFSPWLAQPKLVRDHLSEIPGWDDFDFKCSDPVRRNAMQWLCITLTLRKFLARNHGMISVTHEQISMTPVPGFKELYARLGIAWSDEIEGYVRKHTESSEVSPESSAIHHHTRSSESLVTRWMKDLSASEIETVREITGDVAEDIFGADAWDIDSKSVTS